LKSDRNKKNCPIGFRSRDARVLGSLKWLRGVTEIIGCFNYSGGNDMFEDNIKEMYFTTQKDRNFMYLELAVNF